MRFPIFAASALLAYFSPAAFAQTVCEEHALGAALDFWVGEWRVVSPDGETEYGANRIEKALQGCAVFEHWTSARGGEGKSLFFFDARDGAWEQVWVTTDTSRPGGLKHKKLIEAAENGALRFQGEYAGDNDALIYDRTTLTPLPNGTVRQLIEISTDQGETWRATFDAIYEPADDAN